MNYPLNRKEIANGVFFSSIVDKKFKHNRISINMLLPLEKEKISHRAIIPYLLRQGTKQCPNFTELNKRLWDMYGASVDASVDQYGAYQILCLGISGIDSRLALGGEDMVGKCASLLAEMLLEPNITDGAFPEQDTALERQYLIDAIESEVNDKRIYAVGQCKQIMCEGEAIALRKLGTVEGAQQITPASAATAYQEAISTARIEIMFVGGGEPSSAQAMFENRFAAVDRSPIVLDRNLCRKLPQIKGKEVVEPMEVKQGKLVMGFYLGAAENREDFNAKRMAIAILGGTPMSLLFNNVREKLSLCYYCQSRYDSTSGIMMVDSGVEMENVQAAKEEILRQVEHVKQGEFEDSVIHETKLILKTALRATTDSLSGLESWYLTQILNGTQVSPEQDIDYCTQVTKEQIVQAANKIQLDTVYTLSPKDSQKGDC